MRLLLLNGPNLNLLGTRQPQVYGTTTLPELEALCRSWAGEVGASLEAFQSNHEGSLIDRLHEARGEVDGVVFNPGALTHSSYALHDAIQAVELPVVEVHISDVEAREPWRRVSLVRPACVHTVFGRGVEGYRWAIRHLHWNRLVPGRRVRYGEHPAQQVVVRVPDRPTGLVVLVHGGFWRGPWAFDTIEGAAVDLHRAGVATAVVEHRRTGPDHPGPAAMVDDVCDAVIAAGETTGIGLDLTVFVGHSAGAQLAALVVKRLGAAFVVSLAGVLDLEAGAALGGGAVADYLAGEDPAHYSPAAQVPLGAPVLVMTAGEDTEIPPSQAARFVAAARAAGDDVRSIDVPGDHYAVLDPASRAWQAAREAIVRLLASPERRGGG